MKTNIKIVLEIILDILISALTFILGISAIVTVGAFDNSRKHWDNGPLTGYQEASDLFHTMYNFTTTLCIISLIIISIIIVVTIIRIIIGIVKNGLKNTVSTIICDLVMIGNLILITGILLFTHIFTYGMSV